MILASPTSTAIFIVQLQIQLQLQHSDSVVDSATMFQIPMAWSPDDLTCCPGSSYNPI
jgi:hypothetical protein